MSTPEVRGAETTYSCLGLSCQRPWPRRIPKNRVTELSAPRAGQDLGVVEFDSAVPAERREPGLTIILILDINH